MTVEKRVKIIKKKIQELTQAKKEDEEYVSGSLKSSKQNKSSRHQNVL